MQPDDLPRYWDSVSWAFDGPAAQTLWRSHSDRLNLELIENWVRGRRFGTLLKTDLFDEAVTPGLYGDLNRYADRVVGMDFSYESVSRARQRYPDLAAVNTDVRRLPLSSDSVDVIVSNSTLDHFSRAGDLQQALTELRRVLRPGGELLISLDNLQNPIIALRSVVPFAILQRLGLVPYFVGRTMGRRGLVRALSAAGFEVIETRAIMHCPRVLSVARAARLERSSAAADRQRFLSSLHRWEFLDRLPSRYFSGHFVAARARAPFPNEGPPETG